MVLDPDTITQQLALLATHRRTLAYLLQQAAQFGGEVFVPPQTANGIAEARQQIRRIKAVLRKNGAQVEDDPADKTPRRRKSAQPPLSGDVVSGDKVAGDKVMGDKRSITTEGGDYAEGDIDKRQGAFVTGGTIQGPAVGINQGTVNANYTYQQTAPLIPALHQLRAPVNEFVGRDKEIAHLVQVFTKVGGAAVVISGVRGMGGIGKSELAYVVANLLTDAFPDAQLVVELRGASISPLTPEQALQAVIRSFVPEAQLPEDLSQLKGVYNSLLSGKRVLVLVDDASDVGQVRALLPPLGCALLVTSRNRFGLSGMRTIDLEVLPPVEAEQLLLEVCPRIGEHARELAELCGYLPLALRVSAGLLKENDIRNVGRYLEQLRVERLKHLSDPDNPDDPQASVEASLWLSYCALEPAAQSVLCQLSVFPASFDLEAAKAVVVVEEDVDGVLELLRRRNLLEWKLPSQRCEMHVFVQELAATKLVGPASVKFRHAQHYAQVATRVRYLCNQGNTSLLVGLMLFVVERVHIDIGWSWAQETAGSDYSDTLLLDFAAATINVGDLRYTDSHKYIPLLETSLLASQRRASKGDESAILNSLGNIYCNIGSVQKGIAFCGQSLSIAREIGDPHRECYALNNLGVAYGKTSDLEKAIAHWQISLGIAREIRDLRLECYALNNLATAYMESDVSKALAFCEQALNIARETEDRRIEGSILENLGIAYSMLRDFEKSNGFRQQALSIAREIGDKRSTSISLYNQGQFYFQLNNFQRASVFYRQSIELCRDIGDQKWEASALICLGNIRVILGDVETAITYFEQALTISREIGEQAVEVDATKWLAKIYLILGDSSEAILFYDRALNITREIGDRNKELAVLKGLGQVYQGLGEVRRAIEFYEHGLSIARAIGDQYEESNNLAHLGMAYAAMENEQDAIEYSEQALNISREISNLAAELDALLSLGLAYGIKNGQKAIECYEQYLTLARDTGFRLGEATASWYLGKQLAEQGELSKAIVLMQLLVDYQQEIGSNGVEKYAIELEQLRQRLAAAQGTAPAERYDEI